MASLWRPEQDFIEDAELIGQAEALTYAGCEPCHPRLLSMLGGISRRLLRDPRSRRAPQFVALGYWLRPAALTRLANELTNGDRPGRLRTPRGVALHLPPTNVDTIFVYSWAMSVIAGNANIVRLPEQMSPETGWLAASIMGIVAEHDEADRQIFCHYAYGDEVERRISSQCDLRMIWGGDEKVRVVSQCPIRPDGLSIGFPDRKSLAIVSASEYGSLNEAARNGLAVQFFNDIFWFDQMGCGSPRILVWLGEPDDLAPDLYRRMERIAVRKGHSVETGVAIGKFGLSNDLLAEGLAKDHATYGNSLHVNRTMEPAAVLARPHGGGFLCDWVVQSLSEVAAVVSRAVQTITHFGLTNAELELLANSIAGRGGYRIVPIGQALQFDTTWDGIELYEHMTRKILVRVK